MNNPFYIIKIVLSYFLRILNLIQEKLVSNFLIYWLWPNLLDLFSFTFQMVWFLGSLLIALVKLLSNFHLLCAAFKEIVSCYSIPTPLKTSKIKIYGLSELICNNV